MKQKGFMVFAEFDAEGRRLTPWRRPEDAHARAAGGDRELACWLKSIIPGETRIGWREITPEDVWIDCDRAADVAWGLTLRMYAERRKAEREVRQKELVAA